MQRVCGPAAGAGSATLAPSCSPTRTRPASSDGSATPVAAWAIPRTCSNLPAATALVQLLVGHEANALDAQGGSVCAHVGAFAAVQPVNDTDRRRLAITAATIEQAMITYPPHPRFPDVEDAGWRAINAALLGRLSPAGAVAEMQRHAERILGAV